MEGEDRIPKTLNGDGTVEYDDSVGAGVSTDSIFGSYFIVRIMNSSLFIYFIGLQTCSITLDRIISLKYWLNEPFWTRMSSLALCVKLSWPRAVTGNLIGEQFAFPEMGAVGPDTSSSLALLTDFSKLERREAISAMIVFLARRFRGPGGG